MNENKTVYLQGRSAPIDDSGLHCCMEQIIIKLTFERELNTGGAAPLRGAIASSYPELELLHNHMVSGYRYQTPLVQYKVINGKGLIIGLQAGSDVLKKIAFDKESYTLGRESLQVWEREVKVQETPFGITPEIQHYRFLNPWMALNEENFKKFVKIDHFRQKQLLEKILIGNLLSLSKGLHYTVPKRIEASLDGLTQIPVKLKGTPMIGFLGKFRVNFIIPQYWGIGKSTSRGFGTVEMIKNTENRI